MRKDKEKIGTAEIMCPFFKNHDRQAVSCEGITEDSVVRIVFRTREARDRQERIFCGGAYEKCEIYRAICEKYD